RTDSEDHNGAHVLGGVPLPERLEVASEIESNEQRRGEWMPEDEHDGGDRKPQLVPVEISGCIRAKQRTDHQHDRNVGQAVDMKQVNVTGEEDPAGHESDEREQPRLVRPPPQEPPGMHEESVDHELE